MKEEKPYIFQPNELRVGSQLHYDTGEGIGITTIDWQDIKWLSEDPHDFSQAHKPIPLTEQLMSRVRRVIDRTPHGCDSRREFSMTPPGERQVDNNWWSKEIHDFRILHLSPSYLRDKVGDDWVKRETPEFWHCWICSHGTGSSWFLSIRDYKKFKYFHQLQNLFFGLTDQELIVRL